MRTDGNASSGIGPSGERFLHFREGKALVEAGLMKVLWRIMFTRWRWRRRRVAPLPAPSPVSPP